MPQGETYWNPYRLIPVRETVERSAPWTDERFQGHSGIIECTMENLTPLFIGAQSPGQHHPPLRRDGRRVIPGSSLKGMLRSLVEIVGGGCFVVSDPGSPVPKEMQACDSVERLCIACRMFGAMERGRNARVHKGKVGIGDALIQEDKPRVRSLQVLLSNSGVRHEPFYRSPHTGCRDGKSRKLYFHQPRRQESTPPIPQNIQAQAWSIDALLPGHHFDFEVQFTSLTDRELSLLFYGVCLEDDVCVEIGEEEEERITLQGPMRHKIGNAKPLGPGSCWIHPHRLTYFPAPAARFARMAGDGRRVLEGEALRREVRRGTAPFVEDTSPTMQGLRKMMVWDERDPRSFRYPDYVWFQNPAHAQTPLKPL